MCSPILSCMQPHHSCSILASPPPCTTASHHTTLPIILHHLVPPAALFFLLLPARPSYHPWSPPSTLPFGAHDILMANLHPTPPLPTCGNPPPLTNRTPSTSPYRLNNRPLPDSCLPGCMHTLPHPDACINSPCAPFTSHFPALCHHPSGAPPPVFCATPCTPACILSRLLHLANAHTPSPRYSPSGYLADSQIELTFQTAFREGGTPDRPSVALYLSKHPNSHWQPLPGAVELSVSNKQDVGSSKGVGGALGQYPLCISVSTAECQ